MKNKKTLTLTLYQHSSLVSAAVAVIAAVRSVVSVGFGPLVQVAAGVHDVIDDVVYDAWYLCHVGDAPVAAVASFSGCPSDKRSQL